MRERPILFSGPMVRALLSGTKTQTRRPLRDQNPIDLGAATHGDHLSRRPVHDHGKLVGHRLASVRCPYGRPGDRLWVREAWRTVAGANAIAPRDLMNVESFTHYEADASCPAGMGKLRPGMFMPRWASRILLEVTAVRVERLQDISDADAKAEGITGPHNVGYPAYRVPDDSKPRYSNAVSAYAALWASINGFDSWEANPWVWVIEFQAVRP